MARGKYRGKYICDVLKNVRRQIAAANEIVLNIEECRFKGHCSGTCPKCEAELHFLQEQLRRRRESGRLVRIAGISVGAMAMLMPAEALSQVVSLPQPGAETSIVDSVSIVKGTALSGDRGHDGKWIKEPLVGATVCNLDNGCITATDMDGNFSISAEEGNRIRVSFVGYEDVTVMAGVSDSLPAIVLPSSDNVMGEVIVISRQTAKRRRNNSFEVLIVDINDRPVDPDDIDISIVDKITGNIIDEAPDYYWNYETGCIYFSWLEEEPYHLGYRDGRPLDEVTLKIKVKGCGDPQMLTVKNKGHHQKIKLKFDNAAYK